MGNAIKGITNLFMPPETRSAASQLQKGAGIVQTAAQLANKTPLQQLQEQQLNYANQFKQNLPQMQNQMASQLNQSANRNMNMQLGQLKQQNSARGMAYSGINMGQQQAVRSNAQGLLGQSISSADANLQNASNTLSAQAVETGVGIQQTQQALQNQIYQQAMATQQANNQMLAGAAQVGLLAAFL